MLYPRKTPNSSLTRAVILLVRRLIVASRVGLNSLLDLLNGAAQEVCLAHLRTVAGLCAAANSQRVSYAYARREGGCVEAGAMTGIGASAGQRLSLFD